MDASSCAKLLHSHGYVMSIMDRAGWCGHGAAREDMIDNGGRRGVGAVTTRLPSCCLGGCLWPSLQRGEEIKLFVSL